MRRYGPAVIALAAVAAARAACVIHRHPAPPDRAAATAAPPGTTTAPPSTPSIPAPSPPSASSMPSAGSGDAAAHRPNATGAEAPAGAPASIIPATTRELITGIVPDWSATAVTLQRWRRGDGTAGAARRWTADGEPWQGVIGTAGAAWGSGLHGIGAPDGHAGPVKREGDGKSPAGAFALRGVYGYAPAPPQGTAVPYTQVTSDWQCVDDPASRRYTQIVDRRAVTVDWTSAEAMRRRDALYTWVIDIAHNRAATSGAGSCIFFHVWHGPDAATVGCTAMPEPRLAQLIGGLDPTAVYVLLPRGEYDALTAPWGLPAGEK